MVSQENAFEKSKNPSAFVHKTVGSNNYFILIENNFRILRKWSLNSIHTIMTYGEKTPSCNSLNLLRTHIWSDMIHQYNLPAIKKKQIRTMDKKSTFPLTNLHFLVQLLAKLVEKKIKSQNSYRPIIGSPAAVTIMGFILTICQGQRLKSRAWTHKINT